MVIKIKKIKISDELLNLQVVAQGKFDPAQVEHVQIALIGTISDSKKTEFRSKSIGSAAVEKFHAIGIDVTNLDDQIVFTETCDNSKMILEENRIVFPISTLIDIGRKRALQAKHTTLTITGFISEEEKKGDSKMVDGNDFDSVDVFLSLREGNRTVVRVNYCRISIISSYAII
jgi:hypothetical protein